MLETSTATVQRVRERFCGQGLEAALERSVPERVYRRSFDGRAEARLIALACSQAPEGRERWSMRLLADKAVELGIVQSVSHETVRKTLKKTNSSPTSPRLGDPAREECPLRVEDGGGVGPLRGALRREAPSNLLRRAPLPALLADVRKPLPAAAPGFPERHDNEYRRRGMAHLFVAFEPLTG